MKRADMAMYAAKAAGKGTYRFFSNDMSDENNVE
jgi:predicted signal transduction protein with EAL and GGDEF domain